MDVALEVALAVGMEVDMEVAVEVAMVVPFSNCSSARRKHLPGNTS